MATKRPLSIEEQSDADRLRAAMDQWKAKDPKSNTQHALADACDWSQGNIQNYLGKLSPLNLPAAMRLASAMKIEIDQISPRLAAEAKEFFLATNEGKQTEALVAKQRRQLADIEADQLAIFDTPKPPEVVTLVRRLYLLLEADEAKAIEVAKAFKALLPPTIPEAQIVATVDPQHQEEVDQMTAQAEARREREKQNPSKNLRISGQ